MKRHLVAVALSLVCAAPLVAQDTADPVVATVNGEKITKAKLDLLWNRMSEKMRAQYEKTGGGKLGFLDNYIRKRLVLQTAMKAGFDKTARAKAEVEAATESALFDAYVREVVASSIVTDETIRKFYDENPKNFEKPARARMRLIKISTTNRSLPQAQALIGQIMQDLFTSKDDIDKLKEAFSAAAKKHSEHESAPKGGELGWVEREKLDLKVADAAFTMAKNRVSGIIEGDGALYLLLVEEREQAKTETFEEARPWIREFLLTVNAPKVVEALNKRTAELSAAAKVEIYSDNVE
ncbi:MAG: peptidyl-prolyl cis-trans isomerase [Thermoanaerobaculia bacterium]